MYNCTLLLCTWFAQAFYSAVEDARIMSSWCKRNTDLLRYPVDDPWVLQLTDVELHNKFDGLFTNGTTYEDVRDNVLFDCQCDVDFKLLLAICSALGLKINLAVKGNEYISNNVINL